ncbi:hypothetical protein [Shewanella phaeophyticola]|uniref:Uncharacterized protein n=1 Tax=Shewanella phaeophyticola TaxID=2978345 RepID=A0ABT2NXX9_9GAMM|nr:hypothetical protein [Shewanella sp. KJ10-1]MCT8985260.1 hypothetical protein [Shewanella sp. KJ10-1]
MSYSIKDLIYKGEKSGVHGWNTLEGATFYWHPDWLHIAEDITGHSAMTGIAPAKGKTNKEAAETAIVNHLNNPK